MGTLTKGISLAQLRASSTAVKDHVYGKLGDLTMTVADALEELAEAVDEKADNTITDVGGYFTATTIEGALQEIGADLESATAGHIGYDDIDALFENPPVFPISIPQTKIDALFA